MNTLYQYPEEHSDYLECWIDQEGDRGIVLNVYNADPGHSSIALPMEEVGRLATVLKILCDQFSVVVA